MVTQEKRRIPGGLRLKAASDGRPLGAIGPRSRGWRALISHRAFRRLSQVGFALFIAALAVQHVVVGESGATVTASPEAYCPFGGLESLYKYVTTGGQFVPHTHLSNLVVLAAALLTGLLARSAFCGWVCPLGFVQELVGSLSRLLQKRVPVVRVSVRTLKTHGAPLAILDRPLRLVKYGVLVWAVVGAALFGTMVFRDYDPWSALLSVAELSFTPGIVVLGLTLVASLFVERPWCRYACPLGAAIGLVSLLSPVYLKREPAACKSCALCTKSCPMGLAVHSAQTIKSPNCIGCLECVGSCPRSGALEVTVGLPVVGK